jgi:hypothetical protein
MRRRKVSRFATVLVEVVELRAGAVVFAKQLPVATGQERKSARIMPVAAKRSRLGVAITLTPLKPTSPYPRSSATMMMMFDAGGAAGPSAALPATGSRPTAVIQNANVQFPNVHTANLQIAAVNRRSMVR